jgi:predicted nucleotidyltransferase
MADAGILQGLPPNVATLLSEFVKAGQAAYSSDLVSVVLYGSAAEGRMGPASDVNLLLVVRTHSAEAGAKLREPFLAAEAAIRLRAMFVLESELASVAELFGQKFADIRRRHRVIFGDDLISGIKIPRPAEIFRLRQVLMNLALRLREASIARSGRSVQVARILADALGPLRASAATLLELEGFKSGDAMAALQAVAEACGPQSGTVLAQLAAAHAGSEMTGDSQSVLFLVSELAGCMFERANRLTQE